MTERDSEEEVRKRVRMKPRVQNAVLVGQPTDTREAEVLERRLCVGMRYTPTHMADDGQFIVRCGFPSMKYILSLTQRVNLILERPFS